jgi:hypothetical protein
MMFLMGQWPSFNTLNPILQKCPYYMIHICDTMKDAGLEVRSSQVLILDPSRYVLVNKETPPFTNWVVRCKPIKLHILLIVKDWKKPRIRFYRCVCGLTWKCVYKCFLIWWFISTKCMYTKYIKIIMSWIPPLKTHDKASIDHL